MHFYFDREQAHHFWTKRPLTRALTGTLPTHITALDIDESAAAEVIAMADGVVSCS